MRPDAHGLTLLPFWAGERSPGWSADARGALLGLSLDTRPIEVLRAAMEAVAVRVAEIDRLLRHSEPREEEILATGGALLHSPAWLQIMADVLGRPVQVSAVSEGSSRGAALLGLERLGHLDVPLEQLPAPIGRTFDPDPAHREAYLALAERQRQAYDLLVANRNAPHRLDA